MALRPVVQLNELATQESVWRLEKAQFSDVTLKLDTMRQELAKEREDNVDLRRKMASHRETEFDLRAERDRRQALEAKLAESEKTADQARDMQAELTRLKHDKQSVRMTRKLTMALSWLWPSMGRRVHVVMCS